MQTRAMYATMGLRQQVSRVLPQIVRRVPVGTHGHPEGAIVMALVPSSFALQDLVIPALAPQAAARHAMSTNVPVVTAT
jgi:hypothetical protein